DRQALVTPEDYKISADPQPFKITFLEDEAGIKLVAENSTAEEAKTLAVDSKIVGYVAEHPGTVTKSIQTALKVRRDLLNERLAELLDQDKLDCAEVGKSKRWTLRNTPQ